MLRFSPASSSAGPQASSLAQAAASPSPTLTALALAALTQLFPDASPAFLRWAIAHHLTASALAGRGGRVVGLEEVVERVGEKVLDGLGDLYPHRRPEERLDVVLSSLDGEKTRIDSLNEDLLHLSQMYPSHPLPFLRSLVSHPAHEAAPLHLSSLALLSALPPSFGPAPLLTPHPVRRTAIPAHERLRTKDYKLAVLAWMEAHYPTVGKSSLRGLGAEHNWHLARTRAAVDALVESRSFAARVWGGIASSLAKLGGGGGGGAKKGKGRSNAQQPWEASDDFMQELWEGGQEARARFERDDEALAKRINKEEYERWGEEVECTCCFTEDTWEEMGACAEGHLVCRDCINTHVAVLSPSLTFPDAHTENDLPSSTLIPCPSCPAPPATACTASIELPTLRQHLSAANWANYDKAVREALSRALQGRRRAAVEEEVLACPFCPYTTLRQAGFPLAQPFHWSTWSILTLPLAVIALAFFTLTTFHATTLTFFLPPLSGTDGSEATIFAPRTTLEHTAAYVRHLVRRATHKLNGATLRCRNAACGRDSCLSCGREVWEGEGECACFGGSPAAAKREASEVKDQGNGTGRKDEEKEKEELRLVVERAMTEAAVRTCPRCELGFMKSDSCNKMTCPRDNYKMCYVCRADVSVEGYAHFCPHFRVIPGPCTACNLCDLYLLPDEDTVIRQAGDKARQDWLRRKKAASMNGCDRGWVNGMHVGPLDDRRRRTRDLYHRVDALASREVDRLLRLVGPATSVLDLLSSKPSRFVHLAVRNLSAVIGILLLAVWSAVGAVGVLLSGGLA